MTLAELLKARSLQNLIKLCVLCGLCALITTGHRSISLDRLACCGG